MDRIWTNLLCVNRAVGKWRGRAEEEQGGEGDGQAAEEADPGSNPRHTRRHMQAPMVFSCRWSCPEWLNPSSGHVESRRVTSSGLGCGGLANHMGPEGAGRLRPPGTHFGLRNTPRRAAGPKEAMGVGWEGFTARGFRAMAIPTQSRWGLERC